MNETEAVRQYRPFVLATARQFRTTVPEEDLIQEGLLAVALAARSWKPEGGATFLTWIRQPVYFAMLKMVKEQKRGGGKFRGGPRDATLASPSSLGVRSLDETVQFSKIYSGDDVDSSKTTVHEVIGEFVDPTDVFARERLPYLLSLLDARSRRVIRLRFAEDLTYAQVGKRMRISRERVRQIEAKAIARLKEMMSQGDDES